MGILIQGGTVVTAANQFAADIFIEGETIRLIGRHLPVEGHKLIDARDKLVMPGGIDVHTHLELPVSQTVSSDDFYSGQRAAAFGGTTCHIDFAIQPRGGSLMAGVELWQAKAAAKACIDYSFHANVTDYQDGLLDEIPALMEAGISSIKLLMAYKGVFQVDDTALFKVMRRAADRQMLVMVHAENGDVVAQLQADLLAAGKTAPRYHAESRPSLIEGEATGRAIALAQLSGANLYVVHMTCIEAIEQLTLGQQRGAAVAGETCPQYLYAFDDLLNGTAEDPFAGAKYVCSPPLRRPEDGQALWSALADGRLQTVGTDHCPFFYAGGRDGRPPGKELGRERFTQIPNGLPGIEDRLPVLWHLGVNGGRISPERFVALTSTNPARIFGLYPRKGIIAPGADADLVIWDPVRDETISATTHRMNTDYNVYEGLTVRGWPEKVFLRGQLLVDGDSWTGRAGDGRFIRRGIGQVI